MYKSDMNNLRSLFVCLLILSVNSTRSEREFRFNSTIFGQNKEKTCLKNSNQCYEERPDLKLEKSIQNTINQFFTSTPPLNLNQIKEVGQKCQEQTNEYLRALQRFEFWALQMYDSSAKMPSGLLNGNINQLGDFDSCIKIQHNEIKGKYCLATIQMDLPASSSQYLSILHRLVHSHGHFTSQLEDPSHRVPKFSSINWAFCVPQVCTETDLEIGIMSKIKGLFNESDFKFGVRIEPGMCQISSDSSLPKSTVITILVFLLIFLSVLVASFLDLRGHKSVWISSLALKPNLNQLLSTNSTSPDDIDSIHGIRAINAMLLMVAHKSLALFFIPHINRTDMVEFIAKPWSVICRAASLYTDPFLMISATLTTYTLIGKLERNKSISILSEYTTRFCRIVPSFGALIAFCTFILPWFNRGPFWNLVVTHHSDICKKNWWRNLLFIHNYYGFEEMCLTHTHHIGIDAQLFILTPIFVPILWRWPKKSLLALTALASISTAYRFHITFTMNLSNYIFFGISVKQLFETANNMYILPAHRITVYIMGIMLGYILKTKKTLRLSQSHLVAGNALAVASFCISYLTPTFMGGLTYVYQPLHGALYAAFAPIFWCFAFAWLIWTQHSRQTLHWGFLQRFVALPAWRIWTKISFSVYLTQFPVYFYHVGTVRAAEYYNFWSMMVFSEEYVWVLVASVVLTLFVEMPFANFRKIKSSTKFEK